MYIIFGLLRDLIYFNKLIDIYVCINKKIKIVEK